MWRRGMMLVIFLLQGSVLLSEASAPLRAMNRTSAQTCTAPKDSSRRDRIKGHLEELFRLQSSVITEGLTKITLLFGHVHHAGGTAICQLARNNTIANPRDNCNHPSEFNGPPRAPTSGSVLQQVEFQRSSPWTFYAVELQMPQHLKYNGPFIYGAILRNPYLLLMSQYRRSQKKFQFKGDLIDLVHLQLKYVGVTDVDYRQHILRLQQKDLKFSNKIGNFFRGQAGFILGKYGPTNYTDYTIFNMAKRRLRRFTVVALTEFMVESGSVFGEKLNWTIGDFGMRPVNSNNDVSHLVSDLKALSPDEHAFVRYYTEVDIMLYDYAKCLLNKEYFRLHNKTLHSYPYQHDLNVLFSS